MNYHWKMLHFQLQDAVRGSDVFKARLMAALTYYRQEKSARQNTQRASLSPVWLRAPSSFSTLRMRQLPALQVQGC